MTADEIEQLIRRLEAAGVTTFSFSDATFSLNLRFAAGPALPGLCAEPKTAGATPAADPPVIRASAIGLLRLHHPAAAPRDEQPGPRRVAAGEIVAFLEAGGCLRPVVAEADGRIGAPLRPDGSLVGYGTALFPIL